MSEWLWVFLLLVLAYTGWLWLTRGALYRQLFATEHFQEVAAQVRKLKDAGLALYDTSEEASPRIIQTDPRTTVTSAGLVLFYTIDDLPKDDLSLHTCSISIAGQYTPNAVGRLFSFYIAAKLFGDLGKIWFERSESNVFYTRCAMATPHDMDTFRSRAVLVPDEEEIIALQQHFREIQDDLEFHRMDTDLRHLEGGLRD